MVGLSPSLFDHYRGLDDAALAALNARRVVCDGRGCPERTQLRDAFAGESLLLVNYEHQPAASPYRASHAIYVLESSAPAAALTDRVPDVMRIRTVSLRGFSAEHCIVAAELATGDAIEPAIRSLLAQDNVSYLHAHYAKFGCFAARIDRV